VAAVTLRAGTPDDGEACGRICYEAFRTIAERHGYPPDFPSAEVASVGLTNLLRNSGFYSIVAELSGRIVGSNFLDERSTIAGLGPITVDPEAQDAGVGKQLMLAALERVRERQFPGVRLLQAAYHPRSLSLYAKVGFVVREPIATIQGPPPADEVAGYTVRAAGEEDLEACNRVCAAVHGHDRSGEVANAIENGTAQIAEHGGRVVGYTTGMAFFAHSVAETNDGLKALIGAADEFGGPGFLLPIRNADLFSHCLGRGLRVVQLMTLMTRGLYNEPQGAYLPSILY
jgi:predicted N-acetyltransferase YhbS